VNTPVRCPRPWRQDVPICIPPALRHVRISRRKAPSSRRAPTIRLTQSGSMGSQTPVRSAATTTVYRPHGRVLVSRSPAAHAPTGGRSPALQRRNSCASRACRSRLPARCRRLAATAGRPHGRRGPSPCGMYRLLTRVARDRVRWRRSPRWGMGASRWRSEACALLRSTPEAAAVRLSRQHSVRHGSWRHSERWPNRCGGCAWAFCALPGQQVGLVSPARLVRARLPLPAPDACPPLPRVHGPTVAASGGLLCPPPRRRRPFLRSGWPPGPAGQDRRGSPKCLALLFPPTTRLVDPGGPSRTSPVAVPWCRLLGRSTPRRPLSPRGRGCLTRRDVRSALRAAGCPVDAAPVSCGVGLLHRGNPR